MPTVSQLAAAMATVESGNSPTSLAVINNNPLNLIYAGQPGATPGPGGFAVFATPAAGLQAGISQINLDLARGTNVNGNPTTTLTQLLNSWSPPTAPGNTPQATANYISSVAAATGIDPNADLASQIGVDTSAGSYSAGAQQALDAVSSPSTSTLDASTFSGLDLTDPTTLIILGGIGLAIWFIWGRD